MDDQRFSSSYAAFFAPRTHKFETVSFRLPNTREFLHSYFPHSSRDVTRRARVAGLLGVAIGLVTAFVGLGVDQLTRGLTHALYKLVAALFNSNRFWPGAIVFVLITLAYAAIAACLVVYVAPLGAGSGVPELKSYLNGVHIPAFLSIHTLFVKAVGIAFSLSSGLICGKQGPMIHAGAIVGATMSQFASSNFKWRWKNPHINFLRTQAWKRDFCAVGSAVGIAVAFGSPMGAWMWVYEEACTHWTWELGIITLAACLSGAIVARTLNYLATGLPRGFDFVTVTQFGKLVTPFEGATFLIKDTPAFLALAILGGLTGAILPIINRQITLFRYKHVTKPIPRIVEVLVVTLFTAVIRLIIPYLVDDCRPVSEQLQSSLRVAPLGDYSRFNCEPSQFSPWAAVMYNPTDSVVRGLLFSKGPRLFPAAAVGVAFAYFLFFIVWTYGLAVPAGVFFPALLLGCVYGRLVGIAVQAIFPSRTDVSLTAYAFLGGISGLAGFTRTISVSLIALEATGGNEASFATVFVALVSKLVGDLLYKHGIYDLHIALKGIPFLASKVPQQEQYVKLRVGDVMQSSVIGVRRLTRIGGLVHMLSTNEHHGFPVFLKLSGSRGDAAAHDQWDAGEKTAGSSTTEADNALRRSASSILEQTVEEQEGEGADSHGAVTSRILLPTHGGLQATIFDNGVAHLVHLTDGGEVRAMGDAAAGGQGGGGPQYELMGTIDRGTLVTLLEHECERAEREKAGGGGGGGGGKEDKGVCIDKLDAAWPNAERLKGEGEKRVMERVRRCAIADRVMDLRRFIDTDPVLMSARATSSAAYQTLRSTGARQILVVDTRKGRVCGIMTRKDILPESVRDALRAREELLGVKLA